MVFASPKSLFLWAGLMCLSALAAYRVIAITQGDRWALKNPKRALSWMPRHPGALLVLAERQLADNHLEAARSTAKHLLASEPLEGRGFRILAAVAGKTGDSSQALALYEIAARRSPRDIAARAWLTEHYLISGDYQSAIAQIDMILRKSPSQERVLLPLLVQFSADPLFTDELARRLRRRPLWRSALMSSLQAADVPHVADVMLPALRRDSGLTEAEFDDWIDRLIRQGRWGEAYARWAGALHNGKLPLSLVYNGNFAVRPSNRGFDWRATRLPGAGLEFTSDARGTGFVAHARFRNRPVAMLNLEQPLLLPPGSYRLHARMRAVNLDSEQGLEWVVICDGATEAVAATAGARGTFEWRAVTTDFIIPDNGCEGQWLRLRNPSPSGSPQLVGGELWFDDVLIKPTMPPGSRIATFRILRGKVMASAGSDFVLIRTSTPVTSGQRVMLLDDASIKMEFDNGCDEEYDAVGVYVIDNRCTAPVPDTEMDGSPVASLSARELAAHMDVGQAILDNMDNRPSPPAGR